MMAKGTYALLAALTGVTLLLRCHSQGEEDKAHNHNIAIIIGKFS